METQPFLDDFDENILHKYTATGALPVQSVRGFKLEHLSNSLEMDIYYIIYIICDFPGSSFTISDNLKDLESVFALLFVSIASFSVTIFVYLISCCSFCALLEPRRNMKTHLTPQRYQPKKIRKGCIEVLLPSSNHYVFGRILTSPAIIEGCAIGVPATRRCAICCDVHTGRRWWSHDCKPRQFWDARTCRQWSTWSTRHQTWLENLTTWRCTAGDRKTWEHYPSTEVHSWGNRLERFFVFHGIFQQAMFDYRRKCQPGSKFHWSMAVSYKVRVDASLSLTELYY